MMVYIRFTEDWGHIFESAPNDVQTFPAGHITHGWMVTDDTVRLDFEGDEIVDVTKGEVPFEYLNGMEMIALAAAGELAFD
jgi:hypothetical protein